MTSMILKVRNLAVAVEHNISEEIAAYSPKLHAAADDLEHKLEVWRAEVERWIELHFDPAAERLKDEARTAYEAALKFAVRLRDEAAAKTN